MDDLPSQTRLRVELVNQIFKMTGFAVDVDDPIVIAALLQGAYMQRAGNQVVERMGLEAAAFSREVDRLSEYARQVEERSSSQFAALENLGRLVRGIHSDLREIPACAGLMQTIGLSAAAAFLGSVAALLVGQWFGWLR